ncbi:helix-turn-helix domain-containing protein [Draconibacterium sp.]|uniref:helix-turn-helix domain-containing protein n=1 Tax=Draconibacterium sp. TaxID=1965318 RepID=UPI00356A9551
MEINEKIRRLRIEKGISQADVASQSGIKQASYSNIEKPQSKGGNKSISIDIGKGIAKALGVSFNELFDIEIPNSDQVSRIEEENSKLKKENEQLEKRVNELEKMVSLLETIHHNFSREIMDAIDWVDKDFTDEIYACLNEITDNEAIKKELFDLAIRKSKRGEEVFNKWYSRFEKDVENSKVVRPEVYFNGIENKWMSRNKE